MLTFTGPDDLMTAVEKMRLRAETASKVERSLKRDREWHRARASAFAEVVEMLRDYFKARENNR